MKRILMTIFLFLCIGCTNKELITTIIEENDNNLICINYPNTDYKKLNDIIKLDIDNIYNDFKNKYNNKDELNIDYKINEFDGFINILLDISLNSSNYVKTYFFDINNNNFLNINDIVDNNSIYQIKNNLVKENINIHYLDNYINKLPFFIDNDLNIYINSNNKTIRKNYSNIDYKIDLNIKNNYAKVNSYKINNKVLDINKKYVALTFDDGPSIYTKEIIDTLKKHEVNATFFILGNKVKPYQELLNESLNNGNILGNHSYNHKWLIKLNEDELNNQIIKTNEEIKLYTGFTPTLLRPTYGSVNNKVKHLNMDIVLWTVDTMDWKYRNVSTIVSRATKNLKDGDIILMHDIYKTSALAVDKIITEIKKQSFELVTIPELKEIEKLRNV